MKKLQPEETDLIGEWISSSDGVRGNEACDRIEWLISDVLRYVGVDEKSGGWDKLYRDPDDGRYWLLTYPKSHMHGGGPPALRCLKLTEAEVGEKFVSAAEWKSRMEKLRLERNIRPYSPGENEKKK
jgi:hypothetical protein